MFSLSAFADAITSINYLFCILLPIESLQSHRTFMVLFSIAWPANVSFVYGFEILKMCFYSIFYWFRLQNTSSMYKILKNILKETYMYSKNFNSLYKTLHVIWFDMLYLWTPVRSKRVLWNILDFIFYCIKFSKNKINCRHNFKNTIKEN